MSTSCISRRVQCGNDCRQTGCPTHDIRLEHHHTSDTVSVFEDDKHYITFDAVIWRALVNMEEEMRSR